MEEVADEANRRETDRVHSFNSISRRSDSAQVIPITSATAASPTSDHWDANYDINNVTSANWVGGGERNPQESWLPLTESRNGNAFSASFHLLCSGIGVQALLLPVAFATLGW